MDGAVLFLRCSLLVALLQEGVVGNMPNGPPSSAQPQDAAAHSTAHSQRRASTATIRRHGSIGLSGGSLMRKEASKHAASFIEVDTSKVTGLNAKDSKSDEKHEDAEEERKNDDR